MTEEIVISGFGGQGVLFAGQLLAYAGVEEGKHVTWIPSYGPEMRGGTAHCVTTISDEEIGSPIVRHPSVAMVLNPPSMQRYAPLVKPGGVLLLDSALVSERSGRYDIHEIVMPAKDLAAELGFPQIANVFMIGALLAVTGVLKPETIDKVLDAHISKRHLDALEANKRALRIGARYAEDKVPA